VVCCLKQRFHIHSMPYVNATKKMENVRAWFHMSAPCSDWYKFWIQPSDSSVQAGFLKKNRSEGCPKHMDVAYAYHVYGILVLSRGWKTCKLTSVILNVRLCMWQNERLNPEFYDSVVKFWIHLSNSSV